MKNQLTNFFFNKLKKSTFDISKNLLLNKSYKTHLSFSYYSLSSKSISYHNKSFSGDYERLHGTTVLAFKKNNKVTMIADGLMTLGPIRFKTDTVKIKKLTDNIICGFAGSVADCVSLMELLEVEVEQYPKDLMRSCVNFAKTWRTNRAYRRISASLLISDGNIILNVDGEGNVIEIKDGCIGIGSGGLYAQCAAKALLENNESLESTIIAKKSMDIATDLCIYSNKNYVIQELEFSKDQI